MHNLPHPVIYGLLNRHIGLPEDVVGQVETILGGFTFLKATEEHGLKVAIAQDIYLRGVRYHKGAYFGI